MTDALTIAAILLHAEGANQPNAAAEREEIAVYAIALQRAVEHHCRGLPVPDSIGKDCPYHARILNAALAAAQPPAASLAQAVKAGLAKRFPDDPPMEIVATPPAASQPTDQNCERTNCVHRVGDVCCNDKLIAAALAPSPIYWNGRWACHVSGKRGLGIGNTPDAAHADYLRSIGRPA